MLIWKIKKKDQSHLKSVLMKIIILAEENSLQWLKCSLEFYYKITKIFMRPRIFFQDIKVRGGMSWNSLGLAAAESASASGPSC